MKAFRVPEYRSRQPGSRDSRSLLSERNGYERSGDVSVMRVEAHLKCLCTASHLLRLGLQSPSQNASTPAGRDLFVAGESHRHHQVATFSQYRHKESAEARNRTERTNGSCPQGPKATRRDPIVHRRNVCTGPRSRAGGEICFPFLLLELSGRRRSRFRATEEKELVSNDSKTTIQGIV